MGKIIDWFMLSNRWKHLVGGFVIGALSDSNYSTALSATLAASCLEYKDKAWGGKWDWIDFGLTVAGAAIGRGLRVLIWK